MGKISSYPAATAITADDYLIGNDGTVTKKFPGSLFNTGGGSSGLQATTDPPSGWQDYTPLDITTSGTHILNTSTDYLIRNQNVTAGSRIIVGGRNIVVMGCTRTGSATYTGQTSGEATYGFQFRDSDGQTGPRTIHVEGCRFQNPNLTQGVILNCATADVRLVNNRMYEKAEPLRFINCDHRDGTNGYSTNHPDLIQSWSGTVNATYGFNSLIIDGLSAWSGYQGLFFKEEPNASLGPITMRRMDLHQASFEGIENDSAAGIIYYGGALVWFEDAGTTYTFSDNCFMEVLPNSLIQNGNYYRTRSWNGSAYVLISNPGGGILRDAFQPPGAATVTAGEASFAASYVNGTAKEWTSSAGNFVPAGTVGVGYDPGTGDRSIDPAALTAIANSGASRTLTRGDGAEDWHITLTASCALTLNGGSVAGKVSEWNVIAEQDGTGGRALTFSTTVVWVGGAPTFATTALASNHMSFVQYGTGTIYGHYAGSAAS